MWVGSVLAVYSPCEYNGQKNKSINCIVNYMNETTTKRGEYRELLSTEKWQVTFVWVMAREWTHDFLFFFLLLVWISGVQDGLKSLDLDYGIAVLFL